MKTLLAFLCGLTVCAVVGAAHSDARSGQSKHDFEAGVICAHQIFLKYRPGNTTPTQAIDYAWKFRHSRTNSPVLQ